MILAILGGALTRFLFAVGVGAAVGAKLGSALGGSSRLFGGIGALVGLAALLIYAAVARNHEPEPPTPGSAYGPAATASAVPGGAGSGSVAATTSTSTSTASMSTAASASALASTDGADDAAADSDPTPALPEGDLGLAAASGGEDGVVGGDEAETTAGADAPAGPAADAPEGPGALGLATVVAASR